MDEEFEVVVAIKRHGTEDYLPFTRHGFSCKEAAHSFAGTITAEIQDEFPGMEIKAVVWQRIGIAHSD